MANRGMANPTLRVGTPLSNVALNALFAAAWPDRVEADFRPVHARSLTWVSAWRDEQLVGYVNVATDGGVHAAGLLRPRPY